MEELGVSGGFVLYSTTFKQDYSNTYLNVTCVRDRGYVLLDGVNTNATAPPRPQQLPHHCHRGDRCKYHCHNQHKTQLLKCRFMLCAPPIYLSRTWSRRVSTPPVFLSHSVTICLQLFHGIVDRRFETQLNLAARKGQTLSIIVENQGHINFGTQINGNRKVGIAWAQPKIAFIRSEKPGLCTALQHSQSQ